MSEARNQTSNGKAERMHHGVYPCVQRDDCKRAAAVDLERRGSVLRPHPGPQSDASECEEGVASRDADEHGAGSARNFWLSVVLQRVQGYAQELVATALAERRHCRHQRYNDGV